MTQPGFPFAEPLPPFQGRSPRARHASLSGAVCAARTRSANMQRLRDLWQEPHTLNEVAALSGLPLTSVCSLKANLEDQLEVYDYAVIEWPHRMPTKRCRWRLRSGL